MIFSNKDIRMSLEDGRKLPLAYFLKSDVGFLSWLRKWREKWEKQQNPCTRHLTPSLKSTKETQISKENNSGWISTVYHTSITIFEIHKRNSNIRGGKKQPENLASFFFLDALASLDLKLSVSGWAIYRCSNYFTASASTGLSDYFYFGVHRFRNYS